MLPAFPSSFLSSPSSSFCFFKAVKEVFDLLSFNVKGLEIFSHIQQANIHVKYSNLIFLIKCDINRKKCTELRMSFLKPYRRGLKSSLLCVLVRYLSLMQWSATLQCFAVLTRSFTSELSESDSFSGS